MIRPRNIRSRLALGYAVAVAVTVLIYAGVVYGFTRSSLIEQLDARLHDDFERAEHAFEVAMDGSLDWIEPERPRHGGPLPEAPWAEVVPPEGGARIRRPAALDPSAGSFRVYERDYLLGDVAYRVRVGRSTEPLDQKLRDLLWLLALCFVPIVGLAWVAGFVLARRALRPIDAMTDRARNIGAEGLADRLPVENPDDELGRLATVFNEAFARIEASFDRLRRFTSDAAHELRTPLAALRSVGEVGLSSPAEAEAGREVIASMLEETDRLTRLVDGLLELSRGDARREPLSTETVDLRDVVQAVCDQLGVLASEREQTLVVEGDERAMVSADVPSLRRAIINLVDNAIRHGPPASTIRVIVGSVGGNVVLRVEDEGPGIPAEHQARVFDRFYRVDPARSGSGTGLGLPLAQQAIETAGGSIAIESPPGGGTVCVVTLPAAGAKPSGSPAPA